MLVGVSCCWGGGGRGRCARGCAAKSTSTAPSPLRTRGKNAVAASAAPTCRSDRGARPPSRPPLHSPAGEGHRAGGVAAIAARRLESGPALPRGGGDCGQEAAARPAPIGQLCSDAEDRRRAIGCGLLRPQPASGSRRGRAPAHFRGLTEVQRSRGGSARFSCSRGRGGPAHGPQTPGTWPVAS